MNNSGLHVYARIVAFCTFLLIIAGGLVTSTGSGLAVPDWPLSFGKFFPHMVGGVLFEHGHRMVAGTVVVLTLILVTWILAVETRSSIRWLAIAAIGAILLQASLGGLTVLLRLPPVVSVGHAGLAQIFFCITVTLALLTSPSWKQENTYPDSFPSLRFLTLLTTGIIYVQILLGAVMRHIGAGLAIPDFPLSFGHWVPSAQLSAFPVAINFAHRVGACVVVLLILFTSSRIFVTSAQQVLRIPASMLLGFMLIQVTLGAITVWSGKAVIPATAHVAVGALLLATSLVLTLQAWRIVKQRESFASPMLSSTPKMSF